MVIPREGDIIRLYIQLSDDDAKEVLNVNGRIDKTRWTPERLMGIVQKILQPYTIKVPEKIDWWTLYISKSIFSFFLSNSASDGSKKIDRGTFKLDREWLRSIPSRTGFSLPVMPAIHIHPKLGKA